MDMRGEACWRESESKTLRLIHEELIRELKKWAAQIAADGKLPGAGAPSSPTSGAARAGAIRLDAPSFKPVGRPRRRRAVEEDLDVVDLEDSMSASDWGPRRCNCDMRCFLACILHTVVLPDLTELEPLAVKARERQRKHHHPTHHNHHRRCHHPTASPNAVAGATVIASATATANAAEFYNRKST